MGPWSHAAPDSAMGVEQGRITVAEQHRWFDRWLKGIQNGVDTEPPVRYAVIDDRATWSWRSADRWPPAGVTNTTYYFGAGPSGSVKSANDGLLAPTAPATGGRDQYRVDLTTTTGNASRWDNAVGQGPMRYPDMAPNDARALTYTTEPLSADLTIVGHPVVTLYVSSNQPDGDFYALLEEVDTLGVSRYVTEGMLRASQRERREAPWNNLGLPWQRVNASDAKPLAPGEVAELVFDLLPTATLFNAGHRIRVTIMGADADNTEPPPVRGWPTIAVHRTAQHRSAIQLPIQR
jgi:hypothetical protein